MFFIQICKKQKRQFLQIIKIIEMHQNSRYLIPNPEYLPQKPHSVGPIPLQHLIVGQDPTVQYAFNPHEYKAINYNKIPPSFNNKPEPHRHYAVDHRVILPPSSPQAGSLINRTWKFDQGAQFDLRLSNQSHMRAKIQYQGPARENYHMGMMNQPRKPIQRKLQAQGPIHKQVSSLLRRMSPALEVSPERPTIINFSYGQSNKAYAPGRQSLSLQQRRKWQQSQRQQWQMQQRHQYQLDMIADQQALIKQKHQQISNNKPVIQPPVIQPSVIQPLIQQNTVITHQIIWQHRFVEIYLKFQLFVQTFQAIIEQLFEIQELFKKVDDEQTWVQLRDRYIALLNDFVAVRQQIIIVLQDNHQVVKALSSETIEYFRLKQLQNQQQQVHQLQQKKESGQEHRSQQNSQRDQYRRQQEGYEEAAENQVWEQRYYQVLKQYQNLSREYNIIKAEMHLNMDPNARRSETKEVLQLQSNILQIQSEYHQLQAAYNQLSYKYDAVVTQLKQLSQLQQERQQFDDLREQFEREKLEFQHIKQLESSHKNANTLNNYDTDHYKQLQVQLQEAGLRIEYLQNQLTHNLDMRTQQEHNQDYENKIQNLLQQKNHLINNINELHEELQKYNHYQEQRNQYYQNEINKLRQEIVELQLKVRKSQSQLELAHEINMNREEENASVAKDLEQMRLRIQRYKHQVQEKGDKIFGLDNDLKMTQDEIEEWKRRYSKLKKDYDSYRSRQKQEIIPTGNAENYLNEKLNKDYHALLKQKVYLEQQLQTQKTQINQHIEQALQDKNRKIKTIQSQLAELQQEYRKELADKDKAIIQIKQYFFEEQTLLEVKLSEKQTSLKLFQSQLKALEGQLAERNIQISKFRFQVCPQDKKKNSNLSINNSQVVEKKNIEIQQLKRMLEQRNIQNKENERKVQELEIQINQKIFEINNYKREVYELHDLRSEVEKLNASIKRKNQEMSQLRMQCLIASQLKIARDSLEREKIRLNESVKQKSRECEYKDSTIQSLEKKINSLKQEYGVNTINNHGRDSLNTGLSQSVISNYESLLKQRESEVKKVQYQLQVAEVSISTKQKTIRDLNQKVMSIQRSYNMLKADQENKWNRNENQIRNLNKEIKSLRDCKQQLQRDNQSLKTKLLSLEKSSEEGLSLYSKEAQALKQKWIASEQLNTQLAINEELVQKQLKTLQKYKIDLESKVRSLQERLQAKAQQNEQLRSSLTKRGDEESNTYQGRIRQLDEQLKISGVKIKQLEDQINGLNKKVKQVEQEKVSYRQKLYSKQDKTDAQMKLLTEYNIDKSGKSDYRQSMQKFILKDPEANQVFQRKVIYELKKENEMLKKEIAVINQFSMVNRFEIQQLKVQEPKSPKRQKIQSAQEEQFMILQNNEMISYYKNLNKDLQSRNDELLAANKQLKDKLATTYSGAKDSLSAEYYKSQVTALENQNKSLNSKIAQLIKDHSSTLQQSENQRKGLKQQNKNLEDELIELKSKLRFSENKVAQLENIAAALAQQNQRLERLNKQRSQNDRGSVQSRQMIKDLQIQLKKAQNKVTAQQTEFQRLLSQKQQAITENSKQLANLKESIEWERKGKENKQLNDALHYQMERLRSGYIQIQALVGQFQLKEHKDKQIAKRINNGIEQNLAVLEQILSNI